MEQGNTTSESLSSVKSDGKKSSTKSKDKSKSLLEVSMPGSVHTEKDSKATRSEDEVIEVID